MIFSFLRAAGIRSTAARPVLGDPLCRRRPGFVSIRRAPPHPAATWKRRKNRSARRVCPRILRPARKRQGCERRPSPCLPRGAGRRAGTQLGPFSNRACRRARGGGGSGFSATIAPRAGGGQKAAETGIRRSIYAPRAGARPQNCRRREGLSLIYAPRAGARHIQTESCASPAPLCAVRGARLNGVAFAKDIEHLCAARRDKAP